MKTSQTSLSKMARIRPSRLLMVLAALLGSVALTRVSFAQSAAFTAALQSEGDSSGTLAAATTTQLNNAIADEAGDSPTVTSGTFASDLSYVTHNLSVTAVNADFGGIVTAIGKGIAPGDFASQVGPITDALAVSLLKDSNKATLAQDLAQVAHTLGEDTTVPTLADHIGISLAPADLAAYIAQIANHAAIPLGLGASKDLNEVPVVATSVASLSGLTLAEQASIAAVFAANSTFPTGTTILSATSVEGISLGEPSAVAKTVAATYASSIVKYAQQIAETAALGTSGSNAGAIGAAVAGAKGVASNLAATLAADVAGVANDGANGSGVTSPFVLYEVASQFALNTGTGAGQIPLSTSSQIAIKLTQIAHLNIPLASGSDPIAYTLVADLAGTFVEQIALSTHGHALSATQQQYIKNIVTGVIAANPDSAPDVLGYVDEAISIDHPTASFIAALQSAAQNAATSATALSALDMIYGSGLTKSLVDKIVASAATLEKTTNPARVLTAGPYALNSIGSLDPVETPITDL